MIWKPSTRECGFLPWVLAGTTWRGITENILYSDAARFSTTKMLDGGTDSARHFQAVTQSALNGPVARLVQWLDDFLRHAKSKEELLVIIENFFQVCVGDSLRVHTRISKYFLRAV